MPIPADENEVDKQQRAVDRAHLKARIRGANNLYECRS